MKVKTPDFEFYRNEYNGREIESAADFAYFSERASDELALFARMLPSAAQNDYSRCVCAVAENVAHEASTSRHGRSVASESVNGYYSVTYGTPVSMSAQVNKAVSRHLRHWLTGAVPIRE